jgi:hypothetical protein
MVLDQLDLLGRPLSELTWFGERSEWPDDSDVIDADTEPVYREENRL